MSAIVEEHLNEMHRPFGRVFHRPVASALERAEVLRWGSDDVVKGVLLDSRGQRVLAIIPAARRLDMPRVRKVLHDPHTRLTPASVIARDYPSFRSGVLPPLGSLVDAAIELVDIEVFDHDTVYLAAGRSDETIEMFLIDLLGERPVAVASITQAPKQLPGGRT